MYMGGVTFTCLAMGSTRAGPGKHTVKKKKRKKDAQCHVHVKIFLFRILNGDVFISEYISGIVSYLT